MKALAVFHDPEGCRFRWLLKPGFRHCFCVVDDGENWVLVDARESGIAVKAVTGSDFDLEAFYRDRDGYTVVRVAIGKPLASPFAVRNCVGLVKAVLGVRSLAVTPRQLYRHLTRRPR